MTGKQKTGDDLVPDLKQEVATNKASRREKLDNGELVRCSMTEDKHGVRL